MTNQIQKPNTKYNLCERTAQFGENIIMFVQTIPENSINKPLKSQLMRSGTSVGANYMEADGADSKKDFIHKIGLCKRESKETMHWLRMIAKPNPSLQPKCRELWKEAHELALIFAAIVNKAKLK